MVKKLINSKENKTKDSKKEELEDSKEGFTLDTYDSMEDFIFSIYMAGEGNEPQQKGLIEALDIAIEGKIIPLDTKMPPDIKGKKGSVFDCRLKTTCRKKINIECQQSHTSDFEARLLVYGAKMITSSLGKGKNYNKTKNAIVIAICNFDFLKSPLYHNIITLNTKNHNTHEEFTDKIQIHIIEMTKFRELPIYKKAKKYLKNKNNKEPIEISKGLQYLLFIDSETSHEEKKEIAKMGDEGLSTAIKRIEEALQDEDAYDAFMTYRIEEMHQENIMEEKRKEKKGKKKGELK